MTSTDNFYGVSVCVFTYNVAGFLSQTLDSILEQERKFPIEIIIGDDFSTDGTRELARRYQEKYPDLIRLSFNEANLGGTRNWINTISKCKGKYVSIIDGDDYFCSITKLQEQFALLEDNQDMVLCTHSVLEKYDDAPHLDRVVEFTEARFELSDIIRKGWFMRTGTLFFRNGILPDDPPAWVHNFPYRYDSIIPVFLNMQGYTGNIQKVMTVWRKHVKGMSGKFVENRIANAEMEISLSKKLDEVTGYKYRKQTRQYCSVIYSETFLNLVKSGGVWKQTRLFFRAVIHMNWRYTYHLIKKRLKKELNK